MLEDLGNIKHFEGMELVQEKQNIYSSATGDSMPARNAACHFKCNFKLKKKRGACFQECDKRFPKSEKQDARRDSQAEKKEEQASEEEKKKKEKEEKDKVLTTKQ